MKKNQITIRSSVADYLTDVVFGGDQQDSIEMHYEDDNIWLTQKMMAILYDVDVRTINEHIKKIYFDLELEEDATIRNFRIVQTVDSRQVTRDTMHYNLRMIIAVGFKVNNERAVQFRKWANSIVKDYTIKGWAMDGERLKNGGSVLTVEYFERLLEQIREIRLSERRFYQKITDIYATALDYDRMINDIVFKEKRSVEWSDVEKYFRQYVGDIYRIAETEDIIYIGTDLPDEYSGSNYTKHIKGTIAKAKANAAQAIPEMIEIATSKSFEDNKKNKHSRHADMQRMDGIVTIQDLHCQCMMKMEI